MGPVLYGIFADALSGKVGCILCKFPGDTRLGGVGNSLRPYAETEGGRSPSGGAGDGGMF